MLRPLLHVHIRQLQRQDFCNCARNEGVGAPQELALDITLAQQTACRRDNGPKTAKLVMQTMVCSPQSRFLPLQACCERAFQQLLQATHRTSADNIPALPSAAVQAGSRHIFAPPITP